MGHGSWDVAFYLSIYFIAVWSCPREPMETIEGSQKETDLLNSVCLKGALKVLQKGNSNNVKQ